MIESVLGNWIYLLLPMFVHYLWILTPVTIILVTITGRVSSSLDSLSKVAVAAWL